MPTAVSDIRIAPVGEDLTTPEDRLEILRGLESMHRVDKKLADGAEFALGEWAVLNSSGEAERAGATPVPETFLVFAGTDRFDVAATGQVTLIMSTDVIARTTVYDTGETYAVGDALTVKDLGSGESKLTKQSGAEPVLARVLEAGDGFLVFQTQSAGNGN